MITKPRYDTQSKEFTFTIIKNPHGFHVVEKLAKEAKMNNAYFMRKVLSSLE
jgi:hypothetical protein